MIQTPVQVRFSDCDMAGHIHNAVYLQFFETGRMHFFVSQLGPNWDWREKGLILKKNEVLYHSPGQLEDQLTVTVNCIHIGETSFTLSYQVENQHNVLRAEGSSVMVCMDYVAGKVIPIPSEMLTILKKHLIQ